MKISRVLSIIALILLVITMCLVALPRKNDNKSELIIKNEYETKQDKYIENKKHGELIELPLEEQVTFEAYTKSLIELSMTETDKAKELDILFIGDSRFVGMEQVNTKEYTFFCETGKGYEWYSNNLNEIESLISSNTIIIFGLGVNDLNNIDNYLKLKDSEYFNQIYYLSVNPVDEIKEAEYGYTVSNNSIDEFNSRVQEVFKDRYIDTNLILKEDGFETKDGLHYTEQTYTKIYNSIINNILLIDKM